MPVARSRPLNRLILRISLVVCLLSAARAPAHAGESDTGTTAGAPAALQVAGSAPSGAESAPDARPQSALRFYVPRVLLLVLVAGIIGGILLARGGHILPSRNVPGLQALEEAVARATEMGRPTLFTTGGGSDIKMVQTFAAMPLLREVARYSGEMGNRLMVPVCYPETMPLHLNAMRDGYADAGAMETLRTDDMRFFPGGLFFFAMGAIGWMLEEKPAACFYFGYWVADALLFAETGQTIQAMQIAGTDQLDNIPFFIAACDYTMIGEEFWAASAKLGKDPNLQGSLGAQDLFKLAALAIIVVGCLLCVLPGVASWVSRLREGLR